MLKVLKSLANVRAPQTDACEIVTTPTDGNIRVNANAASKLGVIVGDYLDVVSAVGEDGKEAHYVTKGFDGEGTKPNIGAKLNSPNKRTGGSLQFSSANIYNTLGGNAKMNRVYELSADAETDESGEKQYFKLEFVREEEKRTVGEDAEGTDATENTADQGNQEAAAESTGKKSKKKKEVEA